MSVNIEKKTIRDHLEDRYINEFLPGDILGIIEFFKRIYDRYKNNKYTHLELRPGGYDGLFEISGIRYETDEEYNHSIENEERINWNQIKKDQKEFKRLKDKYGW